MLNQRTLIVLGAGASFDLGMPLGSELSRVISGKVNIKFDFNKQISGDPQIVDVLRLIAQRERCDVNLYRTAGCRIAEGIGYTRSIDSYFAAHDHDAHVKTVGKLAIVQAILEAERGSHLWVDPRVLDATFKGHREVMGSWLNDLMFLLTTGIAKTKNLDRVFDNLAIINFNYDRCIEQFLWYALRQLFQISEADAASLIRDKLNMLRPYGKVGNLPMGGAGVPFGAKLHASQYEEIANGLRTFNEQVEDARLINGLHAEINSCQRVIFLGFHFHKQNTDILTPENLATRAQRLGYGTCQGRSGPDVQVIQKRVAAMFHNQTAILEFGPWNCKQIFEMYTTTWGA